MRRLYYLIAIIPLLISGCRDKNKVVLDTEDMASLMADIHIAEAVVDLNYRDYGSDSAKLLLKQSIYEAHGVTAEQVDSSYAWYGRHIEDYMKVYDRTIEILTERQKEQLAAVGQQIIMDGDSVNVWPLDTHFELSRRSVSKLITFSVPADSNWRNNDVFSLRFKMVTSIKPITARMVIEYADGTSNFAVMGGRNKGFGELNVRVDTTHNPIRIAGYIMAQPESKETVRIDSIALIRLRSDIAPRYFSLRPFNYGIKFERKEDSDSAKTDSIPRFENNPTNTTTQPHPGHHSVADIVNPAGTGNNSHRGNAPQNNNASSRPMQAAKRPTGQSAAQEGLRQRQQMMNSMAGKQQR
jgi:hypothetical protein